MSPNLGAEMVGVVVDDKITKEPAGGCGGLEPVDCVAEIPGDPVSYTHLTLPTTPYV